MSERPAVPKSEFTTNLDAIRNRPDAYMRVRQAAEAFGQLTELTPLRVITLIIGLSAGKLLDR